MPVAISNLSATWSNSNIAFTAISMNVANNGSNADSRLLDLKVDGISKQYTTPNGDIYITGFYHGDGSMLTGIIAGGGATDNIARLIANTAYDKANSANILAFQVGGAVTIANTIASAAFDKANAANVLAFNTGAGSNTYLLATIAGANAAVGAGANAFATAAAAGANAYMIAVQNGANTAVGTGANAFTSATIAGANTAVGTGANTYLLATLSGANTAVGTGANTYLITTLSGANTAVGTGANAFTSATIAGANTAVGTGANTYLLATMAGANTAVGGGANAFATAAAAGANAFMIAVQAGSNTAVGTGANAFTSATIAGANTAVGTGANTYLLATLSGANTAVGAGANTYLLATIAGANTAVGLGANNYSNATFLKLTAAAQTLTGNLNIVGTLTLSGNTVFIDATRLQIDDPLIYLAGNNYTSDIVDIGFIANYVNATGQNVHTGLYREHEDKEYYLFQGYDKEPANNHIGALSNNMTLAVLNAVVKTSNLILGGANAILTIGAAFNKANSTTYTSNVVISVADNTNAALRITQTGTGDAIRVEDSTNPDSTPFVVDADGKFFLNSNTNPYSGLFTIFNSQAKIRSFRNDQFTSARVDFFKSRSTNIGSSASVNSGDNIGELLFLADDGTTYISAAALYAGVDGTPGTNNMPGRLTFSTTPVGSATLSERMRIESTGNVLIGRTTSTVGQNVKLDVNGAINASALLVTGNVGIGTSTPTNKLDINGDLRLFSTGPVTLTLEADTDNVTESDNPKIVFKQDGGAVIGRVGFASSQNYLEIVNEYPDKLVLGTTNAERMTIDATGNVGIGTTSPSAKLDLSPGNVAVAGRFREGSTNVAYIQFTDSLASVEWGTVSSTNTILQLTHSNSINFVTNAALRMRVDSTGNLLIGRTNSTVGQSVKLDVAGAINVASVLINGTALTALTAATQAEQEAASSTTTYVSPGRQHFHPSAAKFWAHFGTSGNLLAGYNVTSITDNGNGVATVNIATDFGTSDYCVGVSAENLDATIDSIADGQMQMIANGNQLAGSVRVINKNDDGTAATDPATWNVWGFGDLA